MRKALLALMLLAAAALAGPDLEKLRASVVQVQVVSQGEDYAMP